MSAVAREFFTVDLRGLRAALKTRAAEHSVTESDFLRSALAAALDDDGHAPVALPPRDCDALPASTQVKLSVRLSCLAAHKLGVNARTAGLSRGAYLTGLIAAAPAITSAEHRAEQIAALIASTSELAVISRDVNDLMRLLRRGSGEEARRHLQRFMSLDADVRRHLELASVTLTKLRSRRSDAGAGSAFSG